MLERSVGGIIMYGLCQMYNVLISSGRIKTPAAGMRCWPIIWNTIKMIYADRYKVARNTLQRHTSHHYFCAIVSSWYCGHMGSRSQAKTN